jgi:hypothetical protein
LCLFLAALGQDLVDRIEEAFSKVKGLLRKAKSRTLEALFGTTAQALDAVSAEDARGYFEHCGYHVEP